MSCWLHVAVATVTCILLSPITCLPLHDSTEGSRERRDLVRLGSGTWLDPSTAGEREGGANGVVMKSPDSLMAGGGADGRESPRDSSGAVFDLLLASLHDHTNTGRQDVHQQREPQQTDKRHSSQSSSDAEFLRKRAGRQYKVDDYGHGLFFGKRDGWGAGGTGEEQKRAGDDYGFGLFFGKRDGDNFDDFAL